MAHTKLPPIPFRVRIGVTGHRKLERESEVRAAVQQVLSEEIEKLFDDESRKFMAVAVNTPLRFSVVTALAEGADQLVAEEILSLAGATLSAVLPLEQSEYLATIISPAGKATFPRLLEYDRNPKRLQSSLFASTAQPIGTKIILYLV